MRWLVWPFLCSLAVSSAASDLLRVMSYNVRYPARGDGPNLWELRRDILIASIRARDPDLVGTQELYHEQGEYIVSKLPEYAWFGVSRRGTSEDEHMGVFYRKANMKLIDSGNFWLSETPEVAGSISWNMSLPRMVTWGLFETASGRRFYFYNTHFAHRPEDEEARLRSAQLLLSRIRALPPAVPVLVTGDFNAPAGGEVYATLTAHLGDAWTAAARRSGPEGTFHGFRGEPTGPRIDWILFRGPWQVEQAETVTYNENGRYPSDHFPVFAILRWREGK